MNSSARSFASCSGAAWFVRASTCFLTSTSTSSRMSPFVPIGVSFGRVALEDRGTRGGAAQGRHPQRGPLFCTSRCGRPKVNRTPMPCQAISPSRIGPNRSAYNSDGVVKASHLSAKVERRVPSLQGSAQSERLPSDRLPVRSEARLAGSTSDGDDVAPRRIADDVIGTLIVAGIRLYRDGLAETLRRQRTIRVLGTAADLDNALALARSLSPNVILVDMVMPDGVRTVRALAQDLPEAKILALGVPETEDGVIACVEAGAAGCVTPEASAEQGGEAGEGIAPREAPRSPLMSAAIFKRVRELAAGRPEGLEEQLTPREREILAL